jgi:dynein heavy chain
MPIVETYGAQPPVELLRQYLDHKGFYDRDKLFFKDVVDTMLFSCAAPAGGGRSNCTPRFVRHHNVLCIPTASAVVLELIFTSIISSHVKKFDKSVVDLAKGSVLATMEMYSMISVTLLPTPARFHYTFNLRDISKVFQGVSQGSSAMISDKVGMVRIWCHECLRVFADRLINDDDRNWFSGMLGERVHTWFDGIKYAEEVCLEGGDTDDGEEGAAAASAGKKPLLFGNYMEPGAVTLVYQHVADSQKLTNNMTDYLDEYNSMTKKPMSLVLFGNAIEHVSRISRVINQPYGNALLVGVGGSGRKSLTTLAVSIADFKLFQIEISKSYGMNEWREDMKVIMGMAGEKDQSTVFLFDDTQIVYESFLEDVNGILNTGEVANLFTSEELMAIFTTLEKAAAAAGEFFVGFVFIRSSGF